MKTRLRRLRQTAAIRQLMRETDVLPRHLVQPFFVVPEKGVRREVNKGLGMWQVGPDVLIEAVSPLVKNGVGAIMLFGVPSQKAGDTAAQLSAAPQFLAQAIDGVKQAIPDVVLMADVCLCAYTHHGHCGIVEGQHVVNDASLPLLANMAVTLAKAGAEFVCPSDMMDGRVDAIRTALDNARCESTSVVSYAVKMASPLYGPFRAAADSAPQFGDRKTYQMPAGNRREALRELALDEAEGADVLLVKPAITNLDLIRDARERSTLPLMAYQVSGEIGSLRAAADAGFLKFDEAVVEQLTSIRRAGADLVVTYFADAFAQAF